MSESVFKTPYASDTPKSYRKVNPMKFHSDSDESVSSVPEFCPSGSSSDANLSIIAEYDEISRFVRTLKSQYTYLEKSYSEFVDNTKVLYQSFQTSREECMRLQERLDAMTRENSDLEGKLALARKFLDKEKRNTKSAEKERDILEMQIAQMKEFLISNKEARRIIPEDTLGKLAFLETDRIDQEQAPHLSCIPEINSTGSILSDFSYSKSEDDLDSSKILGGKVWKKARPSVDLISDQPAPKKRRSSGHKVVEISTNDTVRATTTLMMPKHGPITATSVIEAVPSASAHHNAYAPSAPPPETTPHRVGSHPQPIVPSDMIFQSWNRKEGPPKPNRLNLEKEKYETENSSNNNQVHGHKQHVFQKRTVVLPDNCGFCQSRLRFGRLAWKCKDCKNTCHVECRDKLGLPCIPVINTPNQANGLSVIADYTGTTPPMVPPLIIHCVNEIELRDSNEVGLYRVSGSEKDVKTLKERFLRGKAAPCLNDIDVHVLCGVIKDFLRSLQEPLITKALWNDFASACNENDVEKMKAKISELPQPNRDTLAYMMLHLQRISQKKEIKMPAENLAIVFGPTIVGFSSDDIDDKNNRHNFLYEAKQQASVLKFLIGLPSSFWEMFITITPSYGPSRLQQTPSTDSLLVRNGKTPKLAHGTPKKKRFFPTPPDNRY